MNFQTIHKIENSKTIIEIALKKAQEKAKSAREALAGKTVLQKSKQVELAKLNAIKNSMISQLESIIKNFPSIDSLDEFYRELLSTFLEISKLKKSLGSVNWAVKQIKRFHEAYARKIKTTQDFHRVNSHRREFAGRCASAVKQISKHLMFIEESRKILRNFPTVKTGLFTICISGFPNIGKTTLLNKITGATPEIAAYSFTTRRLNIGYLKSGKIKIQFVDTPGTLNRFEKMNMIEKQAWLALKYLADLVVYIFDLTEPYTLQKQEKLYKKIKKTGKPVLIYLSKTDILETDKINEFLVKHKGFTELKPLKTAIIEAYKKF